MPYSDPRMKYLPLARRLTLTDSWKVRRRPCLWMPFSTSFGCFEQIANFHQQLLLLARGIVANCQLGRVHQERAIRCRRWRRTAPTDRSWDVRQVAILGVALAADRRPGMAHGAVASPGRDQLGRLAEALGHHSAPISAKPNSVTFPACVVRFSLVFSGFLARSGTPFPGPSGR
jgi:hypothetical protein